MNKKELKEMLDDHELWLCDHSTGHRAKFSNHTCESINFQGAKLRGACFYQADCRHADFSNANLVGVEFIGADLANADFSNADCMGANFSGAKLRRATFREAALFDVDFSGAMLENVDLTGAKLLGANLNIAYDGEHWFEFINFSVPQTVLGVKFLNKIQIQIGFDIKFLEEWEEEEKEENSRILQLCKQYFGQEKNDI
jgi:hypothetical protein